MANKVFIILDELNALVSAKPVADFESAQACAVSNNAQWVLATDSLLAESVIERLHGCSSRDQIWDVVTAEMYGLIDAIPVGSMVVAAKQNQIKKGQYPANITREGRKVWDEFVEGDKFKKAIIGRPYEAAFAIATRWLFEFCRRRGIDAFVDPIHPKDQQTLPAKFLRELRASKSFVEQIFRNLRVANCVLRQTNWTEPKVTLRGNMYIVQSYKRINLKPGSVKRASFVLKQHDGFDGEDLIVKPASNSLVKFDVRLKEQDMIITMELDYTKAQLVVMTGVPTTSALFQKNVQVWLKSKILSTLREVVASASDEIKDSIVSLKTLVHGSSESDDKQRFKALKISRKVIVALKGNKAKLDKDCNFSFSVSDPAIGTRPLKVTFKDTEGLGEDTNGSFERQGRYSAISLVIECDFARYCFPTLREDVEDTDLFNTLVHEIIHLLDSKRTLCRDNASYERKVYDNDGNIKLHDYFNTPSERNAYLQSMIVDWAKHGDHSDLDKPFPDFYKSFVEFFNGRNEYQFIKQLKNDASRRVINRLNNYWSMNQSKVHASTNELRVLEEFEVVPFGSEKSIKLPIGSVLRPIKLEDEEAWQVAHPVSVLGLRLKLDSEQHQHCTHIDNEIDTFDGSIDAALELLIEEFKQLQTIRLDDLRVGKVLGPISTWKFADNRAWLHHLNMKVPHPAIVFKTLDYNNEKCLTAIYHHGGW